MAEGEWANGEGFISNPTDEIEDESLSRMVTPPLVEGIAKLGAASLTTTTVNLFWVITGAVPAGSTIEIERALGDGSFSNIDTIDSALNTFEDTGRAESTRYRYQIRAVINSVNTDFSNIVTVVTQTRDSDTGFSLELVLPDFTDDPADWQAQMNQMARDIEEKFNRQVVRDEPCDICVVNGAIVLDAARCNKFNIQVGEPINSVSILHQGPGKKIEVNLFPNGTHSVSGWPTGTQLNKCGTVTDPLKLLKGLITSISVEQTADGFKICEVEKNPDEEAGGESGGTSEGEASTLAIECEQTVGDGDFTSTQANCATFDCRAGTPHLTYRVVGGVGPYTFSVVHTNQSGNSPVVTVNIPNRTAVITPGGVGNLDDSTEQAFGRGFLFWANPSVCSNCNNGGGQKYQCDGEPKNGCGAGSGCSGLCTVAWPFGGTPTFESSWPPICGLNGTCSSGEPQCIAASGGNCNNSPNAKKFSCDLRTQTQKDSGTCEPCIMNMFGVVLTVTDAFGDSVSIVVDLS